MWSCEILADSINSEGHRLTTFEVTLPRLVLAEFNTHRMLSRNSASSRAIPVAKAIEAVEKDPFVPEKFGTNQPGMVAGPDLTAHEEDLARCYWMGARDAAVDYAMALNDLNIHKGLANRILEPFKWHTIICTGTDWSNFFALRTGPDAQAEIRTSALSMEEMYHKHEPKLLRAGQWHTPLITQDDLPLSQLGFTPEYKERLRKISIGRCARVSYLTHHGVRDPEADIGLHDRLLGSSPPHLSPFEHVARPFNQDELDVVKDVRSIMKRHARTPFGLYTYDRAEYAGNLRGWWSARMDIPNESDASLTSPQA